jgi:hypothetical protein
MAWMTIATVGHLFGLALGLGGAFCTELLLLRLLRRPVGAPDAGAVAAVAGAVIVGYGLLVTSGLGFLAIYALESPDKLLNPKLWAKIAIVAVLGLNGLAIHRMVLRPLRLRLGHALLEGMTPGRGRACVLAGAVSTVSWLAAAVLGAVPELNFAGPVEVYLLAWLLVMAVAFLIGLWLADLAPWQVPRAIRRRGMPS